MGNKPDSVIIPGGSRLTLKSKTSTSAPTKADVPLPPKSPKKKKRKGKKLKPGKESGSFSVRFLGQSLGAFVLGGLVLGFFLYHQATGMELITPKQWILARNIGILAFTLLLIVEAFSEDMLQGILCILFPYPYVFGLIFADAGPVRGLTVAVLVFLGAEIYFIPDDALLPEVASTINGLISSGQDKLIYPDGRPDAGGVN